MSSPSSIGDRTALQILFTRSLDQQAEHRKALLHRVTVFTIETRPEVVAVEQHDRVGVLQFPRERPRKGDPLLVPA